MKITTLILSIILSTLILFNSIKVSVTYAYYELDPVGFIEKLCENKNKPELQCNGKCHLKKVAESSTENQQTPTKFISLKEITLFVIDKLDLTFSVINNKENTHFDYNNLYAFSSIYQLDRPPQV